MSMGIGRLGDETVIFKRKFRWKFQILSPLNYNSVVDSGTSNNEKAHVCKTSSRPNFSFDEQEVQHTIEKVYLPGKPTWDPIDITLYDVGKEDYVYLWLMQFYEPRFGRINPSAELLSSGYPKKTAIIHLYDGHGIVLEGWQLTGCWPQSIKWGDLDYSSSDITDISFTMRYDRAMMSTSSAYAATG